MANRYRAIIDNSAIKIKNIIGNIEEKLIEIQDVTKTITEEEVSEEVNAKLGIIEDIVDCLLYELK